MNVLADVQTKLQKDIGRGLEDKIANLRNAIRLRKQKDKQSDFERMLGEVTHRIIEFKELFLQKKPKFDNTIRNLNVLDVINEQRRASQHLRKL